MGAIDRRREDEGRPVAVLQDLGGPKIRTGDVPQPFDLAAGDALTIARGSFAGGPGRIACSFDALFVSAKPGHRLLVNDGHIELEVVSSTPDALDTRVIQGGTLSSHKGINLPGVTIQTSAVTPKDEVDLAFGIALGIDFVAVSFVQTPEDVTHARRVAVPARIRPMRIPQSAFSPGWAQPPATASSSLPSGCQIHTRSILN